MKNIVDVMAINLKGNCYEMDSCVCTINEFFDFDWHEVNTMTRAEAEEKFNIKIVGG